MEGESRRELEPPALPPTTLADFPLETSREFDSRDKSCLSIASSNDCETMFGRGVGARLAGCESLLLGRGGRLFRLGCSDSGAKLLRCGCVVSGLDCELSGRVSFGCGCLLAGLDCGLSGRASFGCGCVVTGLACEVPGLAPFGPGAGCGRSIRGFLRVGVDKLSFSRSKPGRFGKLLDGWPSGTGEGALKRGFGARALGSFWVCCEDLGDSFIAGEAVILSSRFNRREDVAALEDADGVEPDRLGLLGLLAVA